MNRARDLFERVTSGGSTTIRLFVEDGWSESDILDFKLTESKAGSLGQADRKNLAEALSGFSNAEGGVIVWGVKCQKTEQDEADIASGLQPIERLRSFLADIHAQTGQVVSPGLSGVEHFEIPDEGADPDRGFIVTYVPPADGEPRMAIARDQHRHYLRAGSSFIRMTSSMLADRYARRPQPKLRFFWHFAGDEPTGVMRDNQVRVVITVGIANDGRGLARFPALKIRLGDRLSRFQFGVDDNNRHGLPRLPTEARTGQHWDFYAGGADLVIYPNTELAVTKLETSFFQQQESISDLSLSYEIHCDGFSEVGEAKIPSNELERLRFR